MWLPGQLIMIWANTSMTATLPQHIYMHKMSVILENNLYFMYEFSAICMQLENPVDIC